MTIIPTKVIREKINFFIPIIYNNNSFIIKIEKIKYVNIYLIKMLLYNFFFFFFFFFFLFIEHYLL